jgi:L-fuculose-phosphate aldolase
MSELIVRDKAEYHSRTTEQMEHHLAVPPWSLRQKIALTCRILAVEGPRVRARRPDHRAR